MGLSCSYERRRWDLNPWTLAGHTISSRADSAALALLRAAWAASGELSSRGTARRSVRRPGPAQRALVNRVRAGRQQLSAGPLRVPQQTWPSHRAPSRLDRLAEPALDAVGPGVSRQPTGSIRCDDRYGANCCSCRAVPVSLPAVQASTFLGGSRSGIRQPRAQKRRPRGPRRARLPVQRTAGHRKDLDRPDSREGPQLRGPRRRRALRGLHVVHRDRRGILARRPRARRCVQQRRRRHARPRCARRSRVLQGAGRSTSSTRSTCSRRRRRTRC